MTVWRVLGGFILATLLALPLGVLMGAYKPIEAFLSLLSRSPATCRPRLSSPC